MEFQGFLPHDFSRTIKGLTFGGQRSMGMEPLMSLEPRRCLTSILLAVFGRSECNKPLAEGKPNCPG